MNILPNSSSTSSSASPLSLQSSSTFITANNNNYIQQQIVNNLLNTATPTIDNNRLMINAKCSVCDELLIQQNNEQQQKSTIFYRMLAVRPSIGSKDPFFPILETLTQTSAITVPCCIRCSDSLLEQWNEFELKNVPIKNRLYNLSNKMKIIKSTNMMIMTDNNNHQLPQQQQQQHTTNKSLSSIISITGANSGNVPTTRILAHPISLSTTNNNNNNNNSNGNLINLSQQKLQTTKETPSPQDEVLDLSITGANSNSSSSSVKIVESNNVNNQPMLIAVETTIPETINLTTNKSSSGNRQRTSSSSSGNISDNIITISPYSLNSSMTNLIKVSTNPVTALNLPNSSNDKNSSSSSLMTKKPLYSCTLCDEQCTQLYSILLRPMGNCPYFPTLTPEIKITSIDSNGKIGVCESCHHQLILQWDSYQKSNKPILDRKYQLIRKQLNKQLNLNEHVVLNTRSSANSNNNNHLIVKPPPISQSLVSLVAANKNFFCVMCGKDLIALNNLPTSQLPSSSSSGSSINNIITSPQAHIAFSVLTENDTSGNVIQKKLIVQSAQEINLLPFISSSSSSSSTSLSSPSQTTNIASSANSLKQIQLLNESNRVLICHSCFSSINSLTPSSVIHNNCSSSDNNSSEPHISKSTKNQSSSTNLSLNDTSNGIATKTISNKNEPNNQLCLACKQHKSEYWVETKENPEKKPFYPFLHDANELVNGRARVCAQCHLILEIQWDGFENGYVPYNQRVYQLSSSAKRPPPISSSSTQLPSVAAVVTPTTTTTTTLATNSSSPAIITQVVNGQPACPLKIQIAVPNPSSSLTLSSQPSTLGLGSINHIQNNPSEHLLLTTVNTASTYSFIPTNNCQDQRFNNLLNELLTIIGGPHPHLSGTCLICSQHSAAGQTYQIFSVSHNKILSPELGIYPYFPMLKSLSNNKKLSKNHIDNNSHLVCIYCYHSLMAQWMAYHLSGKTEDFSSRLYDCRNFVCYVCGVTTYRQFVRSITVKDFPFLKDHKRPNGALKLNKGESVVTCLNCYQTLTHQYIENERMKVPLEMRKYNWMAVPPPPIPTVTNNIKNTEPIINDPKKTNAHSDRTIIPIFAQTTSLSYQITDTNSINHNGIISSNEILPKTAIILNTNSFGHHNIVEQPISNDSISLKQQQQSTVTTPSSFNPSHTLAPLVAAAIAATPVTIKQEMSNDTTSSEPITTNTINNGNNVQSSSINVTATTTTATTVLRHLARQQYVQIQYPQQIIQQSHDTRLNSSNSINLTTLASVAALAGGSNCNSTSNSSQFVAGSSINNHQQSFDGHHPTHLHMNNNNNNNNNHYHHLNNHHYSQHQHQTELPKAVINSNSFALHFNASNNNNNNNNSNNQQKKHHHQTKTIKTKIERNNEIVNSKEQNLKSNSVNNNNNDVQYFLHYQQRIDRAQAQIKELEESIQFNSSDEQQQHFDNNLSKVNLEVIKLRKKRLAHLNRLKEKIQKLEQHRTLMIRDENYIFDDNDDDDDDNDDDMTEIDENLSFNGDIIDVMDEEDESKVKFLDQVLPPLPLKENDDEDLGKMEFLSLLGLTTHRMKREDDLDNFIQTKMNRRLTHASFKLDWLNEQENDILEVDPNYERFKRWACFRESKINPQSDRLQMKNVRKYNRNKTQFFETLGLKQSSIENKIKNEINWLAVIRNRQMRRKRRLVCVGKQYQNLDEQILKIWITSLVSSIPSDNNNNNGDLELIKQIKAKIIPNFSDYSNYKESKNEFCEKENRQQVSQSETQMMTIDCNPSEVMPPSSSSTIIKETTTSQQQQQHFKKNCSKNSIANTIVVINDNHQQQPVTKLSTQTNKILNPRQFAQEFHESVLLETQKQINDKQQIQSNGSIVNIVNTDSIQQHYQQQPIMLATTTSDAQHAAIIYSDHLRSVINHHNTTNLQQQQHQQSLIDRNGLISTLTPASATIIAPIKASTFPNTTTTTTTPPDKLNIRDQIQKLQHRIDDINRECSGLNEKRNEILMTMQKLEREKTLFQLEIDRLSKCLN